MTPEDKALSLFRQIAHTVPAYAAFLAERGVDPAGITRLDQIPLTSKDAYTRSYPLPDLCRDGVIGELIAVSSGSTGEPGFWPRSTVDEETISARFEQVFRTFHADERNTLAVVCFALGTWVGGLFTIDCCRLLAARGMKITVVAPGSDKREILRILPALAPHFDQVVLLGYPPFLKDVIDSGQWAGYDLKLVTAGETFSEDWRTLIAHRTGMIDPTRSTASLYGTADAGVLGNETPLSIEIRRFLAARPKAAHELFGSERLPTLVQYDPYVRFFEVLDGTLLFTGDNGIPLIRYHIADEGGLIAHDEMLTFVAAHGFHPSASSPEQPFVYVFGRSHFTVSYYGANIYPETISIALEQPDVADSVTGRFVQEIMEDENRDRHLLVTVELALDRPDDPILVDRLADQIQARLTSLNSEFAHYVPPERQRPRIRLRPPGDPDYFPPGVKHRYSRLFGA